MLFPICPIGQNAIASCMTKSFHHFGILGAGAWGTALAAALLRAGRRVTLWSHRPENAAIINNAHENTVYLKGIALDPALVATGDMTDLSACNAWILATPAQHARSIVRNLRAVADGANPILIAAKGIEQKTGALLSAVLAEEASAHPIGILSGPSFAAEVARGLPTALTLAMQDEGLNQILATAMATPAFRIYRTDDVVGTQVGGAIKNVLAVACGIVTGKQMGDNARAALMTRGLAEMTRLGVTLGGRAETLMGLSGLGDMVLTCSSPQSRNMSLGIALGQGQDLASILAARSNVTEGVTTAAAAHGLAGRLGVEMPIVAAVHAILNGSADIDTAITNLLARPLKTEMV